MPDDSVSPASKTSRKQIARNSVYSLGAYALNLPITLFVSRFVVHKLGLGTFGIWAALTAVMAFGGLLTLGVAAPLVKYTAEYSAQGRTGDVNKLINTGIVIYSAIGLVFALILSAGSDWILIHLFHASGNSSALRLLFFAVVLGFTLDLAFGPLESLLMGLQRADLLAGIGLLFSVASGLGSVIVIQLGLGLNGLALTWFLATVLSIVVNWIVAKRHFRALHINPFLFRWSIFRHILGFSSRVQVTTVTLFLNDQVDRWLIAYALGPRMLGSYQLASRAAQTVRGASFAFMSGVMAAGSDLAATDQAERVRRLYLRASRYVAVLDFGLCGAGASLSGPLVWAWLGPGYGRVATTMILILIGYAVWLPNQVTTDMLNGLGRPDLRMKADLGFLAIHIPLSVFLIWRFGYYGTVVGTAIALAGTRLFIYSRGPRIIGVPVLSMLRFALLRPAVAATAAGAASLLVANIAPLSWLWVALDVVTYAVVFGVCCFTFVLDEYDRQLLRTAAGRVRGAAKRGRPSAIQAEWRT